MAQRATAGRTDPFVFETAGAPSAVPDVPARPRAGRRVDAHGRLTARSSFPPRPRPPRQTLLGSIIYDHPVDFRQPSTSRAGPRGTDAAVGRGTRPQDAAEAFERAASAPTKSLDRPGGMVIPRQGREASTRTPGGAIGFVRSAVLAYSLSGPSSGGHRGKDSTLMPTATYEPRPTVGGSTPNQPSLLISTACLSGTLEEQAACRFDQRFPRSGAPGVRPRHVTVVPTPSPRRGRCARADGGRLQPFHVEAVRPDAFESTLRRAERKFDVLEELGASVMLACASMLCRRSRRRRPGSRAVACTRRPSRATRPANRVRGRALGPRADARPRVADHRARRSPGARAVLGQLPRAVRW